MHSILCTTAVALAVSIAAFAYAGDPTPSDVFTITKLSIKLSFAKPANDTIVLKSTLPVPDGFVVDGRMVVVDVGGVTRTFVLDGKGKAKSDGMQLKLAVKSLKGVVAAQDAKLQLKGVKGSWADAFQDEGLVAATVDGVTVMMPVDVTIRDLAWSVTQPLLYTAKQGKSGKAYLAK